MRMESISQYIPSVMESVLLDGREKSERTVKKMEFFQLLPLFQDDVGPDRLSDMIAKIILPDIQNYTKRVFDELGINPKNYPDKEFSNGYLVNPFKKCKVLLVPIEILHKLPVAKSWEDIDHVVSENRAIRAIMNQRVAEE